MASDDALISGNFDELHYLQYALHLPSYDGEKSRIQNCMHQVHRQTTVLVEEEHEPLRAQVEDLEGASNVVKSMAVSLVSLQQCAQRLHYTIQEPYELIQAKVTQLKHLAHCVNLLRNLQRFVVLVSKLQEVVDRDIVRASRALHDVEEIVVESDLRGLEVYDNQMEFVSKASASIRSRAHDLLKRSIAGQNQVDCGMALQCFYLLESLPRVVETSIAENKREALRTIVRALEISNLQKQLSDDSNVAKQQFFGAMEEALAAVVSQSNAIALMWRILHVKRDPVSQQVFATALSYEVQPLEEMWSAISINLKEKIQKIVKRNHFHLIVVSEYPRFCQVLKTYCEAMSDFVRECHRTLACTEGQLIRVDTRQFSSGWLKDILGDVKQHYNAFLVDQNREKIHPLLWKIGAGPEIEVVEVKVDARRINTTLPSQVTSIDPRPFLKFVSFEVMASRGNNDILVMVLQNVLVAITNLYDRMCDIHSKQLLSTPALTKPMSTVEIFVTSLGNVALVVYNELIQINAMLPFGEEEEYLRLVKQLKDITLMFKEFGCEIVRRFYTAATSVFSVLAFNLHGHAAPQQETLMKQFESKFDYFLSRYALLFEHCTSLDPMKVELVFGVWASFLVGLCLQRSLTNIQREAAAPLIQSFIERFEVFCPTTGLYRLQKEAKVMRHLFMISVGEIAQLSPKFFDVVQPIHVILHLFQRVQVTALPSLPTVMNCSTTEFRDTVVTLVQQKQHADWTSLAQHVVKALDQYKNSSVTGEDFIVKKLVLEVCEQQLQAMK